MNTIDFKIGHGRIKSFSEEEPRVMRHHVWAAVGVGVAGIAANLYGQNQQKKANQSAAAQNAALQDKQNQAAWANYLMTRGLNPNGAVTGQLPTNPQAINTRLPLWASANFATPGAKSRWVKKGSIPAAGTLAMTANNPPAPTMADASAPSGSSGSSKINDILIGNPLGIGGKDRSFMDPLGIF